MRLFRRFREVAPNIRLVIRDIDPIDHHRVMPEVPTVLMLPLVVSQTDLLALTSRQMAEQIASTFGVRGYEVPIPIPEPVMYMIWHPSRRNDPAHRWLLQQCLAVAEELQSLVL